MRYDVCVLAAIIAACSTVGSRAIAQQTGSNLQAVTAEPVSNPDQELGRRFLIKAENCRRPKADQSPQADLWSFHMQDKRRE